MKYVLQSLDIQNLDTKLNKLIKFVKGKLCNSFKTFWLVKDLKPYHKVIVN